MYTMLRDKNATAAKMSLVSLVRVINLALVSTNQGLSQDLETGAQNWQLYKLLGVQFLKLDHNILRFQGYVTTRV